LNAHFSKTTKVMNQVLDVTDPRFKQVSEDLFKQLKGKATEGKEKTGAVVIHKPKAAKVAGNAANVVILGHRTMVGKKGSNEKYTVLVLGNFAPSDANASTGNFVSKDLMQCFVFEKHVMYGQELEDYKQAHGGSIGNRKWSELKHDGDMALRSMTIVEVLSNSQWKIDDRTVGVNDYVRMLNLRREVSSDIDATYNSWKCENIGSFEVNELQRLANLGRIEAARTYWVSMRHTAATESLPVPEQLTLELVGLGAQGDKYRLKALHEEIRWHQGTAHQRALMERAIAVPFEGIGDVIGRRFGTLMEPVHFSTEKSEYEKDGEKQVIVDLMGTTFVTQIQDGGIKKVQLCLKFTREATGRVGICSPANLNEFAPRILKAAKGSVWCSMDASSSTGASVSTDDEGQPMADYAIWLDVKAMDFDLAGAIVNTGIEITEEAARKITQNSDQKVVSDKYRDKHPLHFGDAVYEATGSQSGIDQTMYRYFMYHPFLDETKKDRLEEIMKEKKLDEKEAIRLLSAYLFMNAPDGTFKNTDFKRIVLNKDNLATVFGVKISEVERVKKGNHGLNEVGLIELFEESQAEQAPLAITAPPPAKKEDDSEHSESKKRKGRGGGNAGKKTKIATTIESKKLDD